MKLLYTTLFVLLATVGFSQEPTAAIELSELNILYRGYKNKVQVAVTNNGDCDVVVSGSNCMVSRENDYFIVKPGKGKKAILSVSLRKENGETVLVKKAQYRVSNLPAPSLYWGASKQGKRASASSRLLQAKYPPEVPLGASFKIEKWEMVVNNDTITGTGGNLSNANAAIQSVTTTTSVTIKAYVRGGDGILRELMGVWTLGSTSKPKQ